MKLYTTSPDSSHPWHLPARPRPNSIFARLDHATLTALYNRVISTRALAAKLEVSESYLSSVFPGKVQSKTSAEANKRDLITTRKQYRLDIARRVIAKTLTLSAAADLARVCERTMLRAIAEVKSKDKEVL